LRSRQSAELELRDWLGVDLGLSQVAVAQRDRSFQEPNPSFPGSLTEDRATIQLRSLALGLSIHPVAGHRSAFYVAPFVSGVQFHGGSSRFKSHLGYGVTLGTDLPLGTGGWALTASIRAVATWIDNGTGAPPGDNVVGYLFGAGFAYRR
jgi:hypothetical protein